MRRILGFAELYPAARRVQLATNYRCPPMVVAASRRLIAANAERFEKRIEATPGRRTEATAISMMASTGHDWPDRLAALATAQAASAGGCCILARTRAELTPVALALLRAEQPHATSVPTPLEADPVRALLDDARRLPPAEAPFPALLRLRGIRRWRRSDGDDALGDDDHAAIDALLGWAAAFARLDRFLAAGSEVTSRLARLRDPSAPIELVTVHGAKGREWPTVVVVGFEEDRFPNRRALIGAVDPVRAVEEERRLAYVALTRATRRLILAFDPTPPVAIPRGDGLQPHVRRHRREVADHAGHMLVEVQAELLGAGEQHLARHGTGERLVLHPFPDVLRLHVLQLARWAHERDSHEETGELVAGVDEVIEARRARDAQGVVVGAHGVDHLVGVPEPD